MAKYTRSSIESLVTSKRAGFHGRAQTAKEAYLPARKAIMDDPRLSEQAKRDDVAKLADQLREKLAGIREEQQTYERSLTSEVEKASRGEQPTDANSVMLRRDALDRVRNIDTQNEALDVLREALANGDDTLVDAIGQRGRQRLWGAVVEQVEALRPDVADAVAALRYLKALDSDLLLRIGDGAAYAFPTASSVFDGEPSASSTIGS